MCVCVRVDFVLNCSIKRIRQTNRVFNTQQRYLTEKVIRKTHKTVHTKQYRARKGSNTGRGGLGSFRREKKKENL